MDAVTWETEGAATCFARPPTTGNRARLDEIAILGARSSRVRHLLSQPTGWAVGRCK
jgi:hypothetical protein